MTVTAARAEYVKAGFKTVQTGPSASVLLRYGDAARKTDEPVPTFFESQADAQAICDERATLLSADRRQFASKVSGEDTALAMVYNLTAPTVAFIDDQRAASLNCIVSEIGMDFGRQQSSFEIWG